MDVEVTTVSRMESTVRKSPAAISVITQEDIRRSGATYIPELLRMVPGLHVARLDGNKWAIASRGFNDRFAKNLLVQVDGRTVYAPLTAGVFWEVVDYPLEDIERIEVIRGPGASVWGANAVSGIVNIITKSSKDTQGGYVSGGGGNELHGFGDFRLGGKVNDKLTYRIFGKGLNQDEQFSPLGDPNDQWWRASGGVRLDWQSSEADTLTLDGGFLRSAGGAKDGFATTTGSVIIPEIQTIDSAHILGRWSHQVDTDSGWSLQSYWDRFNLDGDSNYRDVKWNTYDVDFQHQFPLGERQRVVWGLGYRFIDATLENSKPDNSFSLDWLDNHPDSQLFSGFVQDQVEITPDRLSLIVGTKLEHNDYTAWEVQPSARLLWTPTERQSVWASVSRAVRTPSFTEDNAQLTLLNAGSPSSPPTLRLVANRAMEAEEVWAYELGYRVQPVDTLSVDTALFYDVHDNLRVTRVNSGLNVTNQGVPLTALQFDNGLEGDVYGAEVAATWRAMDWWRLYAAYSYVKMDLNGNAAEGKDPNHQVYLQSTWDLPANVEFDLIGRFVAELSGFNPGGVPGFSDTVNNYFALDARVAWHPKDNLTLEIVGQNLLDNRHQEFGTNPFVLSAPVEIERSVYAKVTWAF